MKNRFCKFVICSSLIMVISCEEPETVVTNYIHRDGSVTRVIEMRSFENNFDLANVQLPFDTTWQVKDTFDIMNKEDTIRIKTLEKTFRSIGEMNQAYRNDSSYNGKFSRSASLEKKFRWFNTEFRFSEKVERIMEFGYPAGEFLNDEELSYFFSPDYKNDDLKDGPDSLRVRALLKSIDEKTEVWMIRSVISEWIGKLGRLTAGRDSEKLIKSLNEKESEIYNLINEKYSEHFDSLWAAGIVQEELMGRENAGKFRNEADSAMKIASEELFADFKDYSVRVDMPGKLTGTNGYIDSTKLVLWPVTYEYFLTRPYEMWAESKVSNVWAWVVSGLFLLFVLTGIVIRTIKKAE